MSPVDEWLERAGRVLADNDDAMRIARANDRLDRAFGPEVLDERRTDSGLIIDESGLYGRISESTRQRILAAASRMYDQVWISSSAGPLAVSVPLQSAAAANAETAAANMFRDWARRNPVFPMNVTEM